MKKGFSLVEIILAVALFTIFITGIVTLVLQGFSSNQLGNEQTIANQYSSEGLEAVRSIRNQDYSNLINTVGSGITRNAGNVWQLSGANNILDKYTRIITIGDVNRDVSGNIVPAPTGTPDSDTKKITSTTFWTVVGARNNSIALTSYLTNFRKPIESGLILYADSVNNPTIPRYRLFTDSSNTYGAETNSLAGALGMNFVVRTSPTKKEAIAGYTDNTGNLSVLCYNGSTWSQEFTAPVGGAGSTRRFDIAYETNSGDVMVLYSTNTTSTNELNFRTKSGVISCGSANWSGTVNLNPLRTSAIVQWIKMASDRRTNSNLITAIWADGNANLSAMVWSGLAWGNEPSASTETSLEVVSTAQDVDDFDVEYESLSGDVMLVWANSTGANGNNGVRYRTCIGGTSSCTWGAVTTPPTFSDDATNLDISANPNTDEIVFASIGNAGSDLQTGYWSGSAWTNRQNVDNSSGTPLAGTRLVATGWLINGGAARYIIVYTDSLGNGISWYTGNGSAAPTKHADFNTSPSIGYPKKWIDIETDPQNKDRLITTISDLNADLFAKRLTMTSGGAFTWSNSDSGAALETNLSQSTSKPFDFSYWRN